MRKTPPWFTGNEWEKWWYSGLCCFHKEQYERALMYFHRIRHRTPSVAIDLKAKLACLIGVSLLKIRRWDQALTEWSLPELEETPAPENFFKIISRF